jgi:hypothetical protein
MNDVKGPPICSVYAFLSIRIKRETPSLPSPEVAPACSVFQRHQAGGVLRAAKTKASLVWVCGRAGR